MKRTNQLKIARLRMAAVAALVVLPLVKIAPSLQAPVWAGESAAPAATLAELAAQNDRITKALSDALHRDIVSPTGGNVKIEVVPTDLSREGLFSKVVIEGEPAQVKHMRLTELKLMARDIRIDVPFLLSNGKIRTLASKTTLRAVVTEDDLTALLARGKATADMNMKVKYLGDKIQVSGYWHWTLLNGPIVGVGRLRLAPGNTVDVDILSLTLNGAEVPQFVKDQFSARLNPILDYDDVPFQPKFSGLKVVGPRALITA